MEISKEQLNSIVYFLEDYLCQSYSEELKSLIYQLEQILDSEH